MKIYLSHSSSFDYKNELYVPIKTSELYSAHTIILPHEGQVQNSRETIRACDLMVAEVSYSSTGQGIELGWASDDNLPIIFIYKSGTKPSSSLKYLSDKFIEYNSIPDALQQISQLTMLK